MNGVRAALTAASATFGVVLCLATAASAHRAATVDVSLRLAKVWAVEVSASDTPTAG
jgi:hypothetical protein